MKSKILMGLILVTLAFVVTACQEKGPAQKAGEKIDDALENVKHKSKDAIEKAGDKIEEVGDKIEDKTD